MRTVVQLWLFLGEMVTTAYQDFVLFQGGSVFMQVLVGHFDHVTCVAVSILNKSLVVSGSRDANLIVWDINTGNDIHVLIGHLGYVTCVKVTGDGSLAVSGKIVIIKYPSASVKGLL